MIRAHESILNDGTILAMWKVKLDTHTIAKLLHVHESIIANRLARLRDAGAT